MSRLRNERNTIKRSIRLLTIEAIDEAQIVECYESWGGVFMHHLEYQAEVLADKPDLVAELLPALLVVTVLFMHDPLRSGVTYETQGGPRHVGHEQPHLEAALLLPRPQKYGTP